MGTAENHKGNLTKRGASASLLVFQGWRNRAAATAPAAAAQGAAPAAPQGRKKRVAIFDFDYATVQTSTAALFGTNVDVGKGISDLLVTDLVKDGTYSVIERKALDKILTEQNFSNSDRANPNSAAKIGKLLGVDVILSVERVAKEIMDPATDKVIRRLASAVGVIKITELDDISAVAAAVSGSGFKVGDAVKTVTQ